MIARIVGSAINLSNEGRCECCSGLGKHLPVQLAHQRELRSLPHRTSESRSQWSTTFDFNYRRRHRLKGPTSGRSDLDQTLHVGVRGFWKRQRVPRLETALFYDNVCSEQEKVSTHGLQACLLIQEIKALTACSKEEISRRGRRGETPPTGF